MSKHRIGFDIGGTKITGALLAPDGRMLAKERWAVPQDYPALLACISAAVTAFDVQAGEAASVGLGIAGIIDHRQGAMRVCKLPWLERMPVRDDCARLLQRPVRLANDADCFAVSEAADGAGAAYHHIFGVILGTGVGGGQVVGKRLVVGANGVNGEWGHVPLPHWQPEDGALLPCHCGGFGCIEMAISGGGLTRLHQHLHGGEMRPPPEIAALAMQGNAAAQQTLAHFYRLVAKGLSMIVLCLDPDAIIIGGGLRDLPGLCEAVKQHIPDYCCVPDLQTAILPALHDNDSGVRGAAWLW